MRVRRLSSDKMLEKPMIAAASAAEMEAAIAKAIAKAIEPLCADMRVMANAVEKVTLAIEALEGKAEGGSFKKSPRPE